MSDEYKSRVYTDRPAYADYDPPAKFQAIQSIVAKHLKQHPKQLPKPHLRLLPAL